MPHWRSCTSLWLLSSQSLLDASRVAVDNLVQAERPQNCWGEGEAEGALGGRSSGGRLKRTKNQLQYLQSCTIPYNSLQPVLCAKIQVFLENFFSGTLPSSGCWFPNQDQKKLNPDNEGASP